MNDANDLLTQWISWLDAGGSPETTIYLRTRYLTRFIEDHADVLAADVLDLAAWLASHDWSPNTKKSARSSLRSFYGWAVRVGYLTESPAEALPTIRIPRPKPRPASEPDVKRALLAADERLTLALRLAAECGLRRGEIARAAREDVEHDLVGYSLRVVGKGGHVRLVPLPDDLAGVILARDAGWLFPSPNGESRHLTPHHLSKLVSALLPDGFTTHSLRHRCGTKAYAGTRDLRAVQELLGHSSPVITALYCAVPSDDVRAAVRAAGTAA